MTRANQSLPKRNYLTGFGNEFESEALPGALPVGCFSPQKVPYNLYTEKFSTTAFTAPRQHNRRSWFYRMHPSVMQGRYRPIDSGLIRSAPNKESITPPDQLRWTPFDIPEEPTDFIDGLTTIAVNGNVAMQAGIGIHQYLANRSMQNRYFYNADGEMLFVPQLGSISVHTECGIMDVAQGEICVVPRGMKFKVELLEDVARGYICENYGVPFDIPERGPVGSDGYANDRDFMTPVAAYEDLSGSFELVSKFNGGLYACDLNHSPLDVVAWVGNSVPYKYDLARFNTINTVSYDHPDPSIFTVLTSQSEGVANTDFVIFPPRWMVAENTFRPPWYHRNLMSEFMGLIRGVYDAKEEGFLPGGSSIHNCMSPHGPEASVFDQASKADLAPQRYENNLAFMFESRYVIEPTQYALSCSYIDNHYMDCWDSLEKQFTGKK
jgi:homogentisate 1,2-dioxygenase